MWYQIVGRIACGGAAPRSPPQRLLPQRQGYKEPIFLLIALLGDAQLQSLHDPAPERALWESNRSSCSKYLYSNPRRQGVYTSWSGFGMHAAKQPGGWLSLVFENTQSAPNAGLGGCP